MITSFIIHYFGDAAEWPADPRFGDLSTPQNRLDRISSVRATKESAAMSSPEKSGSLLERHWYWLVILFGVICVYFLDTFAPTL